MTVNGELAKLEFDTTFAHGIHAGVRLPQLEPAVAFVKRGGRAHILQDRARSYKEPFTISITKFDGTTAVISNQ